jgi:type III secretion system YscI/HrpB-like protein
MDITATERMMQALQAQQKPSATQTNQEQIDTFTRMLFGQDGSTPEAQAAVGFQQRSLEIDQTLSAVREGEHALTQPLDMLATQSALLRSTLAVDLTAKAAGAVSQGINKLVNMQ